MEIGYCNGIENYSRHLTGRLSRGAAARPCWTIFREDFLVFIDESHIAVPQTSAACTRGPVPKGNPGAVMDSGCRRPWTTGP